MTSLEQLFVLGREFGCNSDAARAKAIKYTAVFHPTRDSMHVTGAANTFYWGKPASKQLRGTKGTSE